MPPPEPPHPAIAWRRAIRQAPVCDSPAQHRKSAARARSSGSPPPPPLPAAGLDPNTKYVALMLAEYVDSAGKAFPGSARLAADTGLHLETVKASMRRLESAGWLTVLARGGIAGGRRASEVQIVTPTTGSPELLVTPTTGSPELPVTPTTGSPEQLTGSPEQLTGSSGLPQQEEQEEQEQQQQREPVLERTALPIDGGRVVVDEAAVAEAARLVAEVLSAEPGVNNPGAWAAWYRGHTPPDDLARIRELLTSGQSPAEVAESWRRAAPPPVPAPKPAPLAEIRADPRPPAPEALTKIAEVRAARRTARAAS